MNEIEQRTRQWLEQAVIGLGLCPFASQPYGRDQVAIVVSDATGEAQLLAQLSAELRRLDDSAAGERETTLLVVPAMLADFLDYNDFLDQVDALLENHGDGDAYQVASFHPAYQFAGTAPGDAENYTNRAPYPILHILREDSLSRALEHYPDADLIPERNIEAMNRLGAAALKRLFAGWRAP
ncbi:hypothetical protein CEK62_15160 [Alcanivorax sp. N3-2A]|nr:hypothetical protein CEK62_15160 [Alcanivorax sp. N3-2A]|tara:strand:+ start:2619 stop:3164 length:546 start_codon:yes stop_codon:yes gene_type:complete